MGISWINIPTEHLELFMSAGVIVRMAWSALSIFSFLQKEKMMTETDRRTVEL